jgi:hypothetical protein
MVRKPRQLVVVSSVLGLGLASAAPVQATCGSTACFLSTLTEEGALPRKTFRLDLSYR